MILEWIQKMLSRQFNQKKQDVVRLRWQRAQLEEKLEDLKKQRG